MVREEIDISKCFHAHRKFSRMLQVWLLGSEWKQINSTRNNICGQVHIVFISILYLYTRTLIIAYSRELWFRDLCKILPASFNLLKVEAGLIFLPVSIWVTCVGSGIALSDVGLYDLFLCIPWRVSSGLPRYLLKNRVSFDLLDDIEECSGRVWKELNQITGAESKMKKLQVEKQKNS